MSSIANDSLNVVEPNPTLREMMEEANNTAKEKGWWEKTCPKCNGTGKPNWSDPDYFCSGCKGTKLAYDDRNLGEILMLCVSELSEAYEEYRAGHNLKLIYLGENGKPEGFPVEIADTIIRLMDLCKEKDIPIQRAWVEKSEYNRTRPYRHGGKLS